MAQAIKINIFQQQKSTNLAKVDLSRKGSIDEPIVDLVHLINQHDQYFTTSSCSGRICVFEEVDNFPYARVYNLYLSIYIAPLKTVLVSPA